jgi:hypothetical protein
MARAIIVDIEADDTATHATNKPSKPKGMVITAIPSASPFHYHKSKKIRHDDEFRPSFPP